MKCLNLVCSNITGDVFCSPGCKAEWNLHAARSREFAESLGSRLITAQSLNGPVEVKYLPNQTVSRIEASNARDAEEIVRVEHPEYFIVPGNTVRLPDGRYLVETYRFPDSI
jgi:hypothetical protein